MSVIALTTCGDGDDFNFSRLTSRLAQGSYPPSGSTVRDHGFDVLVLCARQCQGGDYPGVLVLKCPMDDDFTRPIDEQQWQRAVTMSLQVANHVLAGRRVLVTCRAGLNRSGLVSALTLHRLMGWSGARCTRFIQMCRPGSLFNPRFTRALDQRIG